MRRWLTLSLLASLFALPHARAVGLVDVNRTDYPDTSLVDFSFLVPAPAGGHGFVTTRPDGHFYFADGKRARFWGVNVSSRSIAVPDVEIDGAAARFRRAGLNMIRLEATDNAGMLLSSADKKTSRTLDPAYLRKMHYWMAAAKRNGLYVYLQLLDYRSFYAGDGVPAGEDLGRAAKPYAVFDPKLIALQKEFARQLLETVNPYTGLRPIKDPDIALVELANEHGLFLKGSSWTKLVPPYDAQLRGLWNAWLKSRYGSTKALDKAWTGPGGKHALQPGEALENGTVALPDMSDMTREDRAKMDWTDPARSPARVDDGARFAYGVQRRYFREMRAYLRQRGVKVPITASVSTWIAPDVKSVADELDFTSGNWYWDHPSFEPGKEWKAPFYYENRDPLSDSGTWNAAPYMAALRWKGKPVVVREWSAVWPNEFRAASVPLAATWAAYQDIDAMLAFGYQFTGAGKLGDFNVERDPVRWGLMGLGALLFLRGDVQPSQDLAELVYTEKSLFTYQDYLNSLYRLAWTMRLQNVGASQAGKSKALLSLPAQPTDPDAALVAAINRVYTTDRNIDNALTRIGLIQGLQIIAFNTEPRFFSVVTGRTVILAGRTAALSKVYPGFKTPTPYGAVWIASLDGKRLDASDHYIVKMVSGARNTGEVLAPSTGPVYPDRFALKSVGTAPIVTGGAPSDDPTTFTLGETGEQGSLSIGMVNGTWEFERSGDVARVYCDTPGVKVTVSGASLGVAHMASGSTQPLPVTEGAFTYPADADYVEVRFP